MANNRKGWAQAEQEKADISNELSEALLETAKYQFYGHYGDYLALMNHELKNDPLLAGLEFRAQTIDFTRQLVTYIDLEIAEKAENADARPYIDSIKRAYTFVPDLFDNPEAIISVFRNYATRNKMFYSGVKEMTDSGDINTLNQYLVRDKKLLDSLKITPEMKAAAEDVMKAVSTRFFTIMSWDAAGDYILSDLAREKVERRIRKAALKTEEDKLAEKRDAEAKQKRDDEKLMQSKVKSLQTGMFS
jgi:hypothetical protein